MMDMFSIMSLKIKQYNLFPPIIVSQLAWIPDPSLLRARLTSRPEPALGATIVCKSEERPPFLVALDAAFRGLSSHVTSPLLVQNKTTAV